MSAGSVKCWGYNASGQVGDGSSTDWFIPSDVSVLSTPITAVAAGYSHSCALTSGGSVKCWGLNGSGQMGDGTTTQRTTPADVDGHSSGIASLALGPDSSCALSATGGVKCWGRNNGNVGNGTTRDQRTPSQVTGLTSGVVSISAGGGTGHTCAVFDTGALKCWGYNASGQIGDNSTTTRNTATNVTGSTSGVSAVSTGDLHTCLLSTGGGVKCWGDNTYGQIGDGTITQRLTPTDVFGLTSGVAAISAGNNHTCAVTTLGALQCWGENSTGQLGDGTTTPSLTPTAVSGLTSGVVAVAAGKNYTCALTTGGGVKCWGANNYRTIGDGTFTQRLVPTDTTGLTSGVASITAGSDHTCAVTTGGGAKCWGHNNYGKSSNGTVSSYLSTPADVAGFTSGVAAVAVGGDHTCLLNIGGGMKCWGNGSFGQLGLYWMTTVTGLSGIGLIEKIFALP